MGFFSKVPPALLWLAIAVSLALNVLNVNLANRLTETQESNARVFSHKVQVVCGQISEVVMSINTGRDNNRTLYRNLLADALSRLNTPNELPSDQGNITTYQTYVNAFPVNLSINCGVLK